MQNNGFQNMYQPPVNGYNWNNRGPSSVMYPMPNQQLTNPNYGGMQMTPIQPQTPFIYGRVVTSEEEITIRDVPNDGSAGFYPMADGSAVYMKQWNNNGTISMIRYIPDPAQFGEQKSQEPNEDFMASIDKRFDKLEAMIRKNGYYKRSNPNPKNQNEEVISNESDL